MNVWKTIAKWQQRRDALSGSIGFVPTMGALHHGHAALVERCRRESAVVVVSIFVNPSQFNDPRDLERYPVTLDQDLHLLDSLGADEVLLPPVRELYPHGYGLRIEPDRTEAMLEGAYRPGFLQGVMTIVMKLLNLVRADRAYFGEKDYEQLRTVTAMVREFFVPTQIVACPTVREESGLAMSSRNLQLSPEARRTASDLYRVLTAASDPAEARAALDAAGFRVEYIEDRWGRRLAAAFLDGVRLIDNVPLE